MAVFELLKWLLQRRIPLPSLDQVFLALSILGVAGAGFFVGAGVMHFQLSPCAFLRDAFAGAQAWSERGRCENPNQASPTGPAANLIDVDLAAKTDDGFTLYTTTSGTWAALIDMKGNVVHRWRMPFTQVQTRMSGIFNPLPDNQIHWFGCRLFPNGDLLAVCHADGDTPYGYGLVKLDRDSHVLWTYSGRVHHEADVAEDGSIYCIRHMLSRRCPAGMNWIQTPYLADELVILSPEGKELERVSLLEAFRDSKYASTLQAMLEDQPARVREKGDCLHPNNVMVLSTTLAPSFPLFRAGQVLISLRNIDALAVLDVPRRTIVWMAHGIWRGQHAATFLPGGHIVLYDNNGAATKTRVLQYDPVSQAIVWSYSKEGFFATHRGTAQRLANGNTLIVNPVVCQIFEVTSNKELVWNAHCQRHPVAGTPDTGLVSINSARRYPADQVRFLHGDIHARP